MSETVWFTSDTHFGHANVIGYSNRPFKDIEEMDELLIKNWNDLVRAGDRVYHCGDFALCDSDRATKIASRLMGRKYIVWGNHDKRLRDVDVFCGQFVTCKDLGEVNVDGQKIILSHYAFLVWNQSHRGSWNLHGHSHGSLPDDPNSLRLDVGVDSWDQRPVSFEEIRKAMAKKTYKPVDHHGKRDE